MAGRNDTLSPTSAAAEVVVPGPSMPSMSSRNESRHGTRSVWSATNHTTHSSRGSNIEINNDCDIRDAKEKNSFQGVNYRTQRENSYQNSVGSSLVTPVVDVEPLPWTEVDTETIRTQVAFWKNCLLEDDNRLPKEDIRDLLKTLYSVLRQERVTRNDRALREISQKLADLKALDLMKLVAMMDAQRKAGDAMEDQDVILLTGAVGSGKTTTLHFMAGTEFEETEVDGFMHLDPVSIKDPRIEGYKTSCGQCAVTKCLQTVPVSVHSGSREDLLVICDVPGVGSASTAEEELAFHYGMRNAIARARRIKPVVVFSEELMGSCFTYLPDALRMMKNELSIKTARDLKPVDYIFTHYEERHRTRLHMQFTSLKSNGGTRYQNSENDLYEELVDDIIAKTTPKANLAMPLNNDPQELLRALWNDSFVEEPKKLYSQNPPSELTLKQLQLQLQITLEELKTALSREAYSVALNRIVILDKLATWIPQAKETAKLAKEATSRQVNVIQEWMTNEINEAHYEQVLSRMEQMAGFGLIFPEAQNCSKRGNELIWDSLVRPMEDQDYSLAMERVGKLSQLSGRFEQASLYVKRALQVLHKRMEISMATGQFKDALSVLIPLSNLSDSVAEANECAKDLLSGIKDSMVIHITLKKDYTLALDITRKLTALKPVYPQVGEIADCGMLLCRQIVESSLTEGNYDTALFLVQHMQRLRIEFPQAGEIAKYGLAVISTSLNGILRDQDYSKAIPLMKSISDEIQGSTDCILQGLSQIKQSLMDAIKDQKYTSALEIIYQLNHLAKTVPEADSCIECGFKSLEEHILLSIENQEYEAAIQLMELLSSVEDRLPLAKECTRVGIEVLKKKVSKAIDKKNYSPALEMIQQCSNIAEGGDCRRRGLEMLGQAAQKAITDRDYPSAIEIITNLNELAKTLPPESKAIALLSIQFIRDHIAELRLNVEKTVEEIVETHDLKVFVAMLLKLKSQIEKVSKSEPLRKVSVQMHYKKTFRLDKEKDDENNVPQLYTSQAFCSDHIELLVNQVRSKLPDFDVSEACMDTLIRNRKAMLSVMIRLKAANKILKHCPGGEKATATYTETFEQFHALLETVMAIAEESFKPPIDMRIFELQAWFLAVLVKGFIKDRIDVDSEERKQMEEMESRRRILMLHFEVKMTEAIESLSELDFVANDDEEDESKESVESSGKDASEESSTSMAEKTEGNTILISKDVIESLDLSVLEQQRTMLLALTKRSELSKMALKHRNRAEVERIVKNFDKSLLQYFPRLIKYGDTQYDALLEYAKSGASIPAVLDRANDLRSEMNKVSEHILIVRKWGPEFSSTTLVDHQRLLILQKRLELCTERLEESIKAGNEIGFSSFVASMAKPFACNGRWYNDIPSTFI